MAWTLLSMENALLEMLRTDQRLQNYCKAIDSYAGQLEFDAGHVPQLFPSVYLVLLRAEYTQATNEEYRADVTWGVLIAAQDLAGSSAIRRGNNGAVGMYTILRDIKIALHKHQIDDLTYITLVREEAVVTSKALHIYQAEYQLANVLIQYGE